MKLNYKVNSRMEYNTSFFLCLKWKWAQGKNGHQPPSFCRVAQDKERNVCMQMKTEGNQLQTPWHPKTSEILTGTIGPPHHHQTYEHRCLCFQGPLMSQLAMPVSHYIQAALWLVHSDQAHPRLTGVPQTERANKPLQTELSGISDLSFHSKWLEETG